MERKRGLAIVGSCLFVALAAGQYLQTSSAESAIVAAPVPPARLPPPLRIAAGTPLPESDPIAIPASLTEDKPDANASQPILPTPAPAAVSDPCPVTLDVFANTDAMLSLSLTAPCRPNEGVVVSHATLGVTYQTTATGALFVDIPALDAKGDIKIRFPDGTELRAEAPVPELAQIRRFALQWIEGDSFTLATRAPVITLGTAATVLPMYAQVVTLPSPDTPLAIESAVTETNCGHEALGAAFYSDGGEVRIADLSLALPDCDSAGGFVVLNNPVADMKLAATR